MATEKRRIVKGIEHGTISGYTNHRCRCDACTEANAEWSREYRDTKFAGNPLCRIRGCRRVMSRAYGNGLCYRHAQELQALRRKKARIAAKRKAKRLAAKRQRLKAAA